MVAGRGGLRGGEERHRTGPGSGRRNIEEAKAPGGAAVIT